MPVKRGLLVDIANVASRFGQPTDEILRRGRKVKLILCPHNFWPDEATTTPYNVTSTPLNAADDNDWVRNS